MVLLVGMVSALLLGACRSDVAVDPLRRSRADGLNREAFVNRYRDPLLCIDLSRQALSFIDDSLPEYVDGRLRAYNNIAFAYYQTSRRLEAGQVLDTIDRMVSRLPVETTYSAVEHTIASLTRARLLQRDCRIADSYRLLLEVEQSKVLGRHRKSLLLDYAQSEYYITSLVLNYHYRNGHEADIRMLLHDAEERRESLQVDYAQDMALNYALAYGWLSAGESEKALEYCDANLYMLGLPDKFCLFHYANTLQLAALALKSMPGRVPPDSVLCLYDEAREVFYEYGDPYQMLGGTVSTARYALLVSDTLTAHRVLAEWMDAARDMRVASSDNVLWAPFSAPKLELGLFDMLMRSRYPASPDDLRRWYAHHAELQEYIDRNEREDFSLQQTLADAHRRSRWMTVTVIMFAVMIVALMVLAILLALSLRRLQREKWQLEEAKKRDVERIANVETCLSVLRHDVSPYMEYLRRPDLDVQLRADVTDQLLRTFDNIKSWTRLSLPGGYAFVPSDFALQEVLDDVSRQVIKPAEGVTLVFDTTDLVVRGDRMLVTIMLRNLVNNALQHTPTGSVTVTAHGVDNHMADIVVSDTGTGMTDEQQQALFRADRVLGPGSEHGFGLILCRYIISRHDDLTRRGCKIWVESSPGRGTTIYCRLAQSL